MTEAPLKNCIDCQSPVGCRIARTCINAAKTKARESEQLANPVPPSPAPQAAPVDPQVQQAAAAAVAQSRLCRGCKHAVKPLTAPGWNWANCTHPALPVNLVTGQKVFPAVIARGYEELCGWIGRLWEHK